jgi:hypothetical protein
MDLMELFTKIITIVLSLVGTLGLGQLLYLRFSRKQTPQEKHVGAERLKEAYERNETFLLQAAYEFYSREKYIPSVSVIKYLLSSTDEPINMINDFIACRELCEWNGKCFYIRKPKWLLWKKIICKICMALLLILLISIMLLAMLFQNDLKSQLTFTGLFLIVGPFIAVALNKITDELDKISSAKRLTEDKNKTAESKSDETNGDVH